MSTLHVFGDTGGHFKQLRDGLLAIGLDEKTFKLPDSVSVVHCGDLIHKGPASLEVLQLVDRIMEANPGRWMQLLGNHEFQYVDGAPFFWRETVGASELDILSSWFEKGRVAVAYGVDGPVTLHGPGEADSEAVASNGVLFTHSGLTRSFWVKHLGSEASPSLLARAINDLPLQVVTASGEMLGGVARDRREPVGPVWAAGVSEVWESWRGKSMPFAQVHGHTAPFGYGWGRWWDVDHSYRLGASVDVENRRTAASVGGNLLVAVDPGYSKSAGRGPQPSLKISEDN